MQVSSVEWVILLAFPEDETSFSTTVFAVHVCCVHNFVLISWDLP